MVDLDDMEYKPTLKQRFIDYLEELDESYGAFGCWLLGHQFPQDGKYCHRCGMHVYWYLEIKHTVTHAPYLVWRGQRAARWLAAHSK